MRAIHLRTLKKAQLMTHLLRYKQRVIHDHHMRRTGWAKCIRHYSFLFVTACERDTTAYATKIKKHTVHHSSIIMQYKIHTQTIDNGLRLSEDLYHRCHGSQTLVLDPLLFLYNLSLCGPVKKGCAATSFEQTGS